MVEYDRRLTLQVLFEGSIEEADQKGKELALILTKKSYEDIGVNITGLQKVGDENPVWEITVSGNEEAP